jgi:hypothetical protein
MGLFVQACSSCGTEGASFETIGARLVPRSTDDIGYHFASAAAVCTRCNGAVAVELVNERPAHYSAMVALMTELTSTPRSAEASGLQIVWMSPALRTPAIPAGLPPVVERHMLQAERNYRIEGNEEAAAIMYARAIETMLQDKFPHLGGPLAARIEQLVIAGVVPPTMNEWVQETQVFGADGARELDAVDRCQLRLLRGLTHAALRQLHARSTEAKSISS